MKNKLLVVFLLVAGFSFAQPYKSALGIKAGYPGFVAGNYKFFLPTSTKKWALEATAGTNFDSDNRYLSAQLMLEYNTPIGIATGYLWYVGVSPTVQYYTSGGYLYDDGQTEDENFFLRSDAVIGIEYCARQKRIPLTAAFDMGPSFNIIPKPRFYVTFNIALRYTLK